METVQVTLDPPVAVIAIARPQVRNAVDPATAAALRDAFAQMGKDDAIRVIVFTGQGGTFCAGYDLTAFSTTGLDEAALDELGPAQAGPMGPTRAVPPKPTIAAVEGYAVAGGLELAVWCDLRVAAADATFGVFCRRWGVPLIDGGTVRLPRLIGQGRALDMILTGRTGRRGGGPRMGLVDRVVPPGQTLERGDRAGARDRGVPADLHAGRPGLGLRPGRLGRGRRAGVGGRRGSGGAAQRGERVRRDTVRRGRRTARELRFLTSTPAQAVRGGRHDRRTVLDGCFPTATLVTRCVKECALPVLGRGS